MVLTGSVLQVLQRVFEKCYNLLSFCTFQGKSLENPEFSAMFIIMTTQTFREFRADGRYFYGNQIAQVFNKICAFKSTEVLKPLKPQL